MNIWERFTTKQDRVYFRQIGPLKLWIQRNQYEWVIGSDRNEEENETISIQERDEFEPDITTTLSDSEISLNFLLAIRAIMHRWITAHLLSPKC